MKTSTKLISLTAAVSLGLGTVYATVPSFAQDATAEAVEVAEVNRPGPVPGQGMGGPGPLAHIRGLFAEFDTDGDGVVTQDEINAVRAAELAEFDADGDGTLTLEEYQALWLARVYERMVDAFQHLDADGDGQITDEEFNAGLANIVARLDQDGDAAIGPGDIRQRMQHDRDDAGPHGMIMFGPNGGFFGFGGPGPR